MRFTGVTVAVTLLCAILSQLKDISCTYRPVNSPWDKAGNPVNNFYEKVNNHTENMKLLVRRLQISPVNPISSSYFSPFEYPGHDEKKLEFIRNFWNGYYDCLHLHKISLGKMKMLPPKTIMTLEGTTISLKCYICKSPNNLFKRSDWFFSESMGPREAAELVETDDVIIAPTTNALHIFNAAERHTGMYYCRVGNTYSQPYFVHVFGAKEEPVRVVKTAKAPKGPKPLPPLDLPNNIVVETAWGHWTHCSQCAKVGKRYKIGACTVRLRSVPEEARREESGSGEEHWRDIEVMNLFGDGLPCRSRLLPANIRSTTGVAARPSEIMVGFCKVPCTDTIFELRDHYGDLIQTANNSDGVYSSLQGPPLVRARPGRVFQTLEVGDEAWLGCPGHHTVDVPTEWFFKKGMLVPSAVKNATAGRVEISAVGRIHITKAVWDDDGMYTCFQMGEIVGVVRLKILETPKMQIVYWFRVANGLAVLYYAARFVFAVYRHQGATDKVKDPILPSSPDEPKVETPRAAETNI